MHGLGLGTEDAHDHFCISQVSKLISSSSHSQGRREGRELVDGGVEGDEAAAAGADDADDVGAEGDLGLPRGGQALHVGGDGGGARGLGLCR